jgi:hypothetical protein
LLLVEEEFNENFGSFVLIKDKESGLDMAK